ncbi:MAG: preprotein translocase subunit SecE [Elusimicrobia bacterium RIFCSPLOWO2_01_FULL_64_13]|nr:MAG: preprotein translocase subunit SecE [Elusimicrobia bacterium RIFCSPLOWO2_01_FULL_64_13]
MLEAVSAFLKESYAELQKVTWLSRKEVMGSTVVIIILIGILSLFVTLFDFIFIKLIHLVI